MKKQKKLLNYLGLIAIKDVLVHGFFLSMAWCMTIVSRIVIFHSKLYIWNTYQSAHTMPYKSVYVIFSSSRDFNALKRFKFIYTPKITLAKSYAKAGEELAEIIGAKRKEKINNARKDYQDLDNKLTRLLLMYYVLNSKESEELMALLPLFGIKAKDREDAVKKLLGSIKMIQVKMSAKEKEIEKDEVEHEKPVLVDMLLNANIFSSENMLSGNDFTVADYGIASVAYKRKLDSIKEVKNGRH